MRKVKIPFLIIFFYICISLHFKVFGEDVLTIVYGHYRQGAYVHLRDALSEAGYNVYQLSDPSPGAIATAINNHQFSQIYLYDCDYNLYLTSNQDKQAIVNWYHNLPVKTILIDTRCYYLAYTGAISEKNFIKNIAYAFSSWQGGLYIGVDHYPTYCQNGNALLSALNYPTCTGWYGNYMTSLANSPIFHVPYTITLGQLNWGATASTAPVGLMPDGVLLVKLGWVNDNIRYIVGSNNLLQLGPTPTPTASPTPPPLNSFNTFGIIILILILTLALFNINLK